MVDYSDLKALNKELEDVATNFGSYHSRMKEMLSFYKFSAFYKRKAGDMPTRSELKANFLKVFANKNIYYTSPFPSIKIPGTPEDRDNASMREKILLGVYRKNNAPLLQRKYAKDATLRSIAINETYFDLKSRCVTLKRHNPERVFWQLSNDGDNRVIAFWSVWAITKEEAIERYGVTPTHDSLANAALLDPIIKPIDGKEWFTFAMRWDEKVRVAWIGNQFVEKAHNHMLGVNPIDICMPFNDDDDDGHGAFFLDDLIPLQAELNQTIRLRSLIVNRMSNPVVWGRGIFAKQFDEISSKLSQPGGGFVGLKEKGELGLLQVQDVKMIKEQEESLKRDMQQISGFSAASFGESVGANTSGDALGMYFTPTQKMIDDQNIAWVAFWESIGSKVLMAYDKFGKLGETFKLNGFSMGGTVLSMDGGHSYKYSNGAFSIEFDPALHIAGNYFNRVIPKSVTPKNELEEKRLVKEAVDSKFISRATGYEMWEIQSPEDEFAMLQQEQSEPLINPDGTQKILQTAQAAAQPAAMPAGSVPQNGA